jgi:hypothetical protein
MEPKHDAISKTQMRPLPWNKESLPAQSRF